MKWCLALWVLCWSVVHADQEWVSGVRNDDPYQYIQEGSDGCIQVTGLDVELLKETAKEAGFALRYAPQEWIKSYEPLKKGVHHVEAGCAKVPELDPYVHYSDPYCTESLKYSEILKKDSTFNTKFNFLESTG